MKCCLEKAVRENSQLQDCCKMIGSISLIYPLIHRPLSSSIQRPKQLLMNPNKFSEFVEKVTSLSTAKNIRENEDATADQNSRFFHGENVPSISEKKARIGHSPTLDDFQPNQKNPESKGKFSGDELKSQIENLLERKKLLSPFDVNGSTLNELIDVVEKVYSVLCEKHEQEKISNNKIPTVDKTFKDKNNKRIFVEGKLEFDYRLYKLAASKAKPNNFCSFAYQLVKVCFPEQYYLNVSLGKKFESTDNKDKKSLENKKYSLPYILGFPDPFNKPKAGECDLIKGHERVRALIGE